MRAKIAIGVCFALVTFFGVKLVVATLDKPNDEVLSAALQSDGKIILSGKFTENRLMRKNTDGTDDDTFSSTWQLGGFNLPVHSVAVQADDKIIAAGEFSNFDDTLAGHIARLNANGTLDTEFMRNLGTGFDDSVITVAIQDDGKILAGGLFMSFNGTSVRRVARLNLDGTLDTSFAPMSGFDAPVLTIESQPNGEILVGGEFRGYQDTNNPYVLKLTSNGSVSSQFALKPSN